MAAKFHVAICGGGIGGLTLALALTRHRDIAIDVYEAAARFEDVGAGLAIWGRGSAVLRKLGLEEKLRAIATTTPGRNEDAKYELRRADQPLEGELFGYLTLTKTFGLHRTQFISLLAEMLTESGGVNIHFKKRCISFTQQEDNLSDAEPVTLHFTDMSSVTCDVLIGCDGIRSAIRRGLHRSTSGASEDIEGDGDIRFSGCVAYRALVQPEELRMISDTHSAISIGKVYCGKEKHIVTYPVGGGRFINFIAYSSDSTRSTEWQTGPWVAEADQQELLDQYKHFEPEVQAMLKSINKSSRWALYDVEPLQSWSRGRVTLLGDAAHATTPFIGSGGGQVLEDAYILSSLLGLPTVTRDALPDVLRAYEQVRRPRANGVTICSREARQAFEFLGEYEHSKNEEVAHSVNRLTEWLLDREGDADDDVREAERLLQTAQKS